MVLLPNVPFADGDIVTPEVLNLAFNQVFDGQTQYLGHYPLIVNTQLSGATGQVKQVVDSITSPFLVTYVSALTVNVASGVVATDLGTVTSVATSNIVLPDNKTTYIYLNTSGVVTSADRLPTVCRALAKGVTSGGVVTTLTDLRSLTYRSIGIDPQSALVFGGQSVTDKVCTAGENLTNGLYYFRDFTVPSGVTVTVPGYANIKCSGKIVIDGTLTVTPIVPGGAALSPATTSQIYNARPGTGLGTYGGVYPWGLQPYGSGGQAGQFLSTGVVPTVFSSGSGGNGGGGLKLEAAQGITVTGTINARGGNAVTGALTSAATIVITGSAGGSGGCVIFTSKLGVTLSPTSTINVQGGNGSNGFQAGTTPGAGGGGGAGGVVVILCPTGLANTTGSTINLTGGTSGLASTTIAGTGYGAPVGAGFATAGGNASSSATTPIVAPSGTFILLADLPLG